MKHPKLITSFEQLKGRIVVDVFHSIDGYIIMKLDNGFVALFGGRSGHDGDLSVALETNVDLYLLEEAGLVNQ